MIAIVDYGLGNVQALANIYHRLGIPVCRATRPEQLKQADRVLLPGVGSFDWAMARLEASGMRETLDRLAQKEGKPVLGICVGMQMMARSSQEGNRPGLGWIDAEVLRFKPGDDGVPAFLPHMGWNDVTPTKPGPLFRGLEEGGRFYFLHSYYFAPKAQADIAAETHYGGPFASAVSSSNIHGVQFHPEKSHAVGIRLLQNFAEG